MGKEQKNEMLSGGDAAGYEDAYAKIQASKNANHDIDELYLIQLFDYNCPSCTSGVTKVFAEDIEEFSKIYQSIEKDNARVERFLRSKSGEVVTDYYSDDSELNIVQKVQGNLIMMPAIHGMPSKYMEIPFGFAEEWMKKHIHQTRLKPIKGLALNVMFGRWRKYLTLNRP